MGTSESEDLLPGVLRGRTFWDLASKEKKKVCILNPFLAYPAWPVNGVMISGPPFASGAPTCFPKALAKDYDLPEMGGFEDFPAQIELNTILEHCIRATKSLTRFASQLLEDMHWDLFFTCFLSLDRIEHFFWRFGDPDDPSFPGPSRFQNTIKEFYVLIDEAVGNLCCRTDSDDAVMVVSDHGHRRRPANLVNLNELLRQSGMLFPRGGLRPKLLEKTRSLVVTSAQKLKTERLLFRIGKYFPKAAEIRKSELSLDFERSVATLSDFAGSSSFGGITFNESAIRKAGLEGRFVESRVMELLTSIADPVTKAKLVKEVYPREKIYKGKFLGRFPDILFVLRDDYAVHWSIYDRLVVPDYAHRLVSGGHSQDAVFILSGQGSSSSKRNADLVDITPTILHILGIGAELGTTGKSLLSDIPS